MNLILFSVTTFAVLDYFYRFMRFVSTDLAKIAKFLCFYSKSGLKNYDDMRVMRMIKKQLIQCESTLELLRKEYEEKDDQLLALGIKKEVTNRTVDEEEVAELTTRLEALKKEIQEIEEDKSKMAAFNAYTRQ